jgi:hypothetical protein
MILGVGWMLRKNICMVRIYLRKKNGGEGEAWGGLEEAWEELWTQS